MKGATKVEEIRMPYRAHKTSYPDCETLIGSYDKSNKTIVVCIPDGRMKNSGVRGKCFHWYTFKGVENRTGRQVETTVKAVSVENAIKRLSRDCTWDIR